MLEERKHSAPNHMYATKKIEIFKEIYTVKLQVLMRFTNQKINFLSEGHST